MITAEEELGAVKEYQRGSRVAGDRLLAAHEGFIVSKAVQYKRTCDIDDLLQVGREALLRSALSFKESAGCRLITYADKAIWSSIRVNAIAQHAAVSFPKRSTREDRAAAQCVSIDDLNHHAAALTENEIVRAVDIRSEIGRTKKRRAEVLSLRIRGFNFEEIGAELGMSTQRAQQLMAEGWWPAALTNRQIAAGRAPIDY